MSPKESISRYKASFYIKKMTYENNERVIKVVKELGSLDEIKTKSNGQDPIEWVQQYVSEINENGMNGKEVIFVEFWPFSTIDHHETCFNGGYLFLQKFYNELAFERVCKDISSRYLFDYDLNSILSRHVYARSLYPLSKLSTFDESQKLIESPNFNLYELCHSLNVISKESDYIQNSLYKNSVESYVRNTSTLFYDFTNFYFEIDEKHGLNQYGIPKEQSVNPIVQLGLLMDGNGVPLAFCINPGNTNERITQKPLVKKIVKEFNASKFVICTDAGLASQANRMFKSFSNRAFITTQSIKQMPSQIKDWILDKTGWRILGSNIQFDLRMIEETEHSKTVFFKERNITINGADQRLIVTFSIKLRNQQRSERTKEINNAMDLIINEHKTFKTSQIDYKRFVRVKNLTNTDEICENTEFFINDELVKKESAYDGYIGISTNLLDPEAKEIIKVITRRSEVKEIFRTMKAEFELNPVCQSKDERIRAHFTTCFISLAILRMLESKLDFSNTSTEISGEIREMNYLRDVRNGYIPLFKKSDVIDGLSKNFGFRIDNRIVTLSAIEKLKMPPEDE
ncbi:MAG: IS1634 family transposase [Christensenellaceae bacterium]|jgi:transposase|nr:IS1634 family transposase [Christensenellaceae bacterium]